MESVVSEKKNLMEGYPTEFARVTWWIIWLFTGPQQRCDSSHWVQSLGRSFWAIMVAYTGTMTTALPPRSFRESHPVFSFSNLSCCRCAKVGRGCIFLSNELKCGAPNQKSSTMLLRRENDQGKSELCSLQPLAAHTPVDQRRDSIQHPARHFRRWRIVHPV